MKWYFPVLISAARDEPDGYNLMKLKRCGSSNPGPRSSDGRFRGLASQMTVVHIAPMRSSIKITGTRHTRCYGAPFLLRIGSK
jgi:hypothetical protein